ncbi:MAG TPA: fatty acid desaturase [Cyclobacteriaceae bacterium]|jgi:omega-6 fatty acid desaturase (delta-12 desaturase)|nr:fatty acid desaturase [Cyclobacteriaceae bacterium]
MRCGKQLISDSKKFSCECRWRSWAELASTIIPTILLVVLGFLETVPLPIRIFSSVICGLLYVRLFVIYHDYQHRAILQNSAIAHWIMIFLGIYLLAPETIWKRSHEHHHNNNSKLTLSGIGSYPTVSKVRFLKLSTKERRLYLINRHPLTVMFGYFTLFIYWLNVKSYIESPKKHFDSLLALVLHVSIASLVMYFYGPVIFIFGWCFPFFLAFSMGAYLFYSQHNFPEAKFRENHEWAYDQAAIASTSRMVMNPVMHWFTGNIGYHHVHHLNSRIPFYRLREAMDSMPELNNVPTTSWHPVEMFKCLRLKVWDAENGKMITLKQLRLQTS